MCVCVCVCERACVRVSLGGMFGLLVSSSVTTAMPLPVLEENMLGAHVQCAFERSQGNGQTSQGRRGVAAGLAGLPNVSFCIRVIIFFGGAVPITVCMAAVQSRNSAPHMRAEMSASACPYVRAP